MNVDHEEMNVDHEDAKELEGITKQRVAGFVWGQRPLVNQQVTASEAS